MMNGEFSAKIQTNASGFILRAVRGNNQIHVREEDICNYKSLF